MIAAVDPNVLTAVIGVPVGTIIAIGTIWGMNRARGRAASIANGSSNGFTDHVTSREMRDALEEMRTEVKGDVNSLRVDINARLDLMVKLLNGGRS